jgi:hypothetical protein
MVQGNGIPPMEKQSRLLPLWQQTKQVPNWYPTVSAGPLSHGLTRETKQNWKSLLRELLPMAPYQGMVGTVGTLQAAGIVSSRPQPTARISIPM